ncbi:MAG TPA: helix-hairpin-helix domain-containing protein [Gemmatimonadaceae bacterium]|nr:helix-hairpin-helix domain-containing protein [Gemmatimonadaceae bacterium]
MPTQSERTALIFLSSVVLAGGVVRLVGATRGHDAPPPAAAAALISQRRRADSLAGVRKADRQPTNPRDPLPVARIPDAAPGARAPIDLDRASEREIETLPRIGPALAARIVAERNAHGPFESLQQLDKRVRGVGPSMAKLIAPLVTFSGR